jgi:23S rRNA (cytidine1920-2'-O)/16S rRNA (cytidine1409-2'-O)-methyltransferase
LVSADRRRRLRLDVALVERGLAPSRERAQALILARQVQVDGQPASKAGASIAADARVELVAPDHPYVGRGGLKLAHALDVFGIDPAGRRAADIGSSTGGFVDVLLQRGAALVVAVDVGKGQLDWRLRNDPRVLVREGINARSLAPHDLPSPMDIITIDVSFISLRLIFPVLPPLLATGGDVAALVKPQFEAGRQEVGKHGLVTDPAVHAAVLERVTTEAAANGLVRIAMTPSPITGATGNREFFLHLRASESPPAAATAQNPG